MNRVLKTNYRVEIDGSIGFIFRDLEETLNFAFTVFDSAENEDVIVKISTTDED